MWDESGGNNGKSLSTSLTISMLLLRNTLEANDYAKTLKDFASPGNNPAVSPLAHSPRPLTSVLWARLFVFIQQLLRCWGSAEGTRGPPPPLHLQAWNRLLLLTEKSHWLTSSPAAMPEAQTLGTDTFVWASVWQSCLSCFIFLCIYVFIFYWYFYI